MKKLKYAHSWQGCMNLAAGIIAQAARDYYPHNTEVTAFIHSKWFNDLCETMGFNPEYTGKAIVEGWGRKTRLEGREYRRLRRLAKPPDVV